MPAIFAKSGSSQLLGAVFFLLIFLAAYSTAVGLMEGLVEYVQRKWKLTRLRSAIYLGAGFWMLGVGVVLSYSLWSQEGISIALLIGDDAIQLVNDAGFHDVIIYFASSVIQPLVALFLCLFVAWILPREVSIKGINARNRTLFELWNYLLRYVTPLLIFIVFLDASGII